MVMKYLKRFNEALSALNELEGKIYNRLSAHKYEQLEYWGQQDDITPKEDKDLDIFVEEYIVSKGFPLSNVDKQKFEMTHRKGLTDYKRTYFFDIQIPFNCDMVIQKLEDDIWLIECFIPETPGSTNVNSRMWVCDTIEGVEECLKENF
jgi:hypothetical protein